MTRAGIRTHAHTHTHIHVHKCTRAHTHIHVYKCTRTHTHVHKCTCTHIHIHAHKCTRTHSDRPGRLTVGGQQGMGGILLREPLDLVDFLLYLQALEIVELWLVALESAVDVILALAVWRIFALQGNQTLSSRMAGWVGAGQTRTGPGTAMAKAKATPFLKCPIPCCAALAQPRCPPRATSKKKGNQGSPRLLSTYYAWDTKCFSCLLLFYP